VLVVAMMLPVMQVLDAGARGCHREFRTPAIQPGAAARRLEAVLDRSSSL
jgi:hypothetical protein